MAELLGWFLVMAFLGAMTIWGLHTNECEQICERSKWNTKSHNKIHDGENDEI